MNERYLTSFEDQTSALSYTSGDATLVSPQVSLVGADEVVYSKEIPSESRIRFAKDEATGKLYFVVDGVFYDALTLKKANIPAITYGKVDLGLSVKWADRNVGAETPQDNGAYFSWGSTSGVSIDGTDKWLEDDLMRIYLIEQEGVPAETITQEMIDMVKSQFGENIKMVIENYLTEYSLISGTTFDWATTPYYSGVDDNDRPLFSKYNETDGLTVLEAIDDAAKANMGSDWRMPTSAETLELVENTDHYYIDLSGNIVAGPFDYGTSSSDKELDGSKLRSICFVKKGETFDYDNRTNFIEFPVAGGCFGSLLGDDGLGCFVWSSSVSESNVEYARYLYFDSGGNLSGDFSSSRYGGRSVRGVTSNYKMIDLNLPSGTKWADKNVGAKTPQDNGVYFSWGNVEGHVVDENGNVTDGYTFDSNTYSTTLGGQYAGSTLDVEHDAATVNMGSEWRMPTVEEISELVQNTDHYYIGEDGNIVDKSELSSSKKLRSICFVKKGEVFNYNDSSNFIEIPCVGFCDGSLLVDDGLVGGFWSSSVYDSNAKYAHLFGFINDGYIYYDNEASYRDYGRSVRGVHV